MARFTENPVWSGISELYRNPESTYIADEVLPIVPVAAEIFSADYYPVESLLVAPDNEVGRLDRPVLLDFEAKQREFRTKDYAYDAPLPNYDVQRAEQQRTGQNSGFNPEDYVVQGVTEIHTLRREIRAANLVFNPATYLPTQRQVVAGPSQWTNTASRPIDQIMTAINAMLIRPNRLVLSRESWTGLSRNPQVVEAVKGTAAKEGVASLQQVQELLEIQKIVVGDSWKSVADRQDLGRAAANINRLWGPHAALLHVNPNVRTTTGSNLYTFGMTARWGIKKSGWIEDPDMGARGGRKVRVLEHCRELITASLCGYYFENAVAPAATLNLSNVM
jgi:hypothetical protein